MAIDDNTTYGLTGAQIKELPAKIDAVKGLAKELTTADYNYPENNPTSVAVWLLDAGIYKVPKDFHIRVGQNMGISDITGDRILITCKHNQLPATSYLISRNLGTGLGIESWQAGVSYPSQTKYPGLVLTSDHIANSLDSTWTTRPLSANQGKVLNKKIEERIIQNAGAPTTATVGTVGKLLEDITNGKLYICTDATNPYVWEEVGGGGSGAIELTTADYNWNYSTQSTTNPTGVALWLLDEGVYFQNGGVSVYADKSSVINNLGTRCYFVSKPNGSGEKSIVTFANTINVDYVDVAGGSWMGGVQEILTKYYVKQFTGTSQTDVMSQNAVTSMIYADPSTRNNIRIGNNAQYGQGESVAIGPSAKAGPYTIAIGPNTDAGYTYNAAYSIALGLGAKTTRQGQFDVSTGGSSNTNGYNSSNYRLLTGLYDGQSAHDAVTVGQITPATDSSAPTSSTAGRLGEVRIDTTDNSAYMCVVADDATPSYTWKKITA